MNPSASKQTIEKLLTQIKQDLVQIKMKKNITKINSEVEKLIHSIDHYLVQLVTEKSNVFEQDKIDSEQATRFYNIMLELYLDGFDQLGLEKIIETDEEKDIIEEFRHKFMLLMEEISVFM